MVVKFEIYITNYINVVIHFQQYITKFQKILEISRRSLEPRGTGSSTEVHEYFYEKWLSNMNSTPKTTLYGLQSG